MPELFAHAAVYWEVDLAGQAVEGVDGEHKVVGQLVINPVLLVLLEDDFCQAQGQSQGQS